MKSAACALLVAGAAHAEAPRTTPQRIEVDRDAAPGGRVGLGFDAGEPVAAWGVSAAAGWLERPVRLGAGDLGPGTAASDPVRRRETLALGGAIAVGDSLTLDATVRGGHQVGDRLAAAGDPARLARFVFEDVRLGGRIRVVGDDAQAALIRADVTIPSGDDQQLAGDARWTAAWSLIGRLTLGDVVIAATAGVRLRGAEVAVGDHLIGDELFGAAGASVAVGPAGALGPAQLSVAVLGALGDDVGARSAPSPVEARLGAMVQPQAELAVGVQLGAGLGDQIGAPRLRVLLAIAWAPVL